MSKPIAIGSRLAFVLALVCAAAALAAPPVPAARTGTAMSGDGVPIAFSVYGQGEPTLVFVHGWSCNQSVWKNQIPYFAKRHRVVTLDLAGHGQSGQSRIVCSMRSFGQDVAAVVRKIRARKVVLLGHSMGGAVIIETAQIVPDRIAALVGIDTMQDLGETFSPEQQREFVQPFKDDFKKHTDSFVRGMFVKGTDPKLIDEVIAMMSNASPATGISALEEMVKLSYVANPPKIAMPVWCLNSDLWPTKSDVNRRYVREYHLVIMPGVGHFLMLESPAEFNRRLDGILHEITNRGR